MRIWEGKERKGLDKNPQFLVRVQHIFTAQPREAAQRPTSSRPTISDRQSQNMTLVPLYHTTPTLPSSILPILSNDS